MGQTWVHCWGEFDGESNADMKQVYDFDEEIDRQGTGSVKWEFMPNEDHTEVVPTDAFRGKDRALAMWVADMDFAAPREVIDSLVARAKHGIFGYTGRTESYDAAVAHWMEKRHQWTIRPEWISITPGVVPALYMLVRTFAGEGGGVVIQPPVYYPFYHAIERNRAQVVKNPLRYENGRYTMDFEDLEDKVKGNSVKLAILCHPHNPVGRVWSREELERFGEICLKHEVLVVSDEIHGDLIFPGVEFTSYGTISDHLSRDAIICTAASKTFNLAGLKTSSIIIRNEMLRSRFDATLEQNGMKSLNPFGKVAVEAAYCKGDVWLDQVMEYIAENLRILEGYLAKHVPAIRVVHPEGTYLVWLDCRELGLEKRQLRHLMLNEAKVLFDDGDLFGPEGEGFVRMNIACPRSIVTEALQRIADAVNGVDRLNLDNWSE